MDENVLMSIGVFARRVGLAPSALRFYDDCGLLRPDHVDAATGYRYYAPRQEERAVLVRRLRDAGVPLPDASVVLDGPPDQARAVLRRHADQARQSARAAREVIGELLRGLPDGPACAAVGGAELARAIRQVAPSAARGGTRDSFPALGCVLVEVDDHELRLVATDRYRLAVRALPVLSATGGPLRAAIPVEELHEAVPWLLSRPETGIELDARSAVLRDGAHHLRLSVREGDFPSYRLLLDALPRARHRVITTREALAAALIPQTGPDERHVLATASCLGTPRSEPSSVEAGEKTSGTGDPRSGGGLTAEGNGSSPTGERVEQVLLLTGEDRLVVRGPERDETVLPAVCTGPPLRIAFDPAVLLPALETSVGPDVLLEVSAPERPVVVRSADQGGFTTLVMPVRFTAPVEPVRPSKRPEVPDGHAAAGGNPPERHAAAGSG